MKNKKLLFDLEVTQPTDGNKRHGGGIYGEIVFKRMFSLGKDVVAFYNSSKWFNPEVLSFCESNRIPLIDRQGKTLREIVGMVSPDIIYTPLITKEFVAIGFDNKWTTLHGLRALELPYNDSFFYKYNQTWKNHLKNILMNYLPQFYKKKLLKQFEHYTNCNFIAVSNHSRIAFNCYFPDYHREIKTFYSPSTTDNRPMLTERKFNEKYFLMVSGKIWYKNNLRAIIALDRLFSSGQLSKDFRVIVTGVNSHENFKYKLNNPDCFKFLGYIDDDELEQYYHDAYCFIYPSLNEGFGYPPLEAMRYGVPVLASPVTSIFEVLGDAALYFNPFSIEEIMGKVLAITTGNNHDFYSTKSLDRYNFITARQQQDLDNFISYIFS